MLTGKRKEIYNFIVENPGCTPIDVARSLRLEPGSTRSILSRMARDRFVRRLYSKDKGVIESWNKYRRQACPHYYAKPLPVENV